MIYYRRYILTNRAWYIEPDADLSLHKLKRKVYLIYPILDLFSGEHTIEIRGFLATIVEAFYGQHISEGRASRALGLFFHGSAQMAYTNVVYREPMTPTAF